MSEPLRFLVDRMYVRLGRWLRAAGHDTEIAHGHHNDRALVERALAERRRLVTRDRKMTEIRGAARCVVLLDADGLAPAAAALSRAVVVDWLFDPFSRCLECNVPVRPDDPEVVTIGGRPARDALDLASVGPLTTCPACGKVYWRGGHTQRMRARLACWNAGRFE